MLLIQNKIGTPTEIGGMLIAQYHVLNDSKIFFPQVAIAWLREVEVWRLNLKIASCLLLLGVSINIYALPILQVDGSGQLTGARNVDVSGTLYDVVFREGVYTDIFGNPPVFDASSSTEAISFADALNSVFIDTVQGAFDTSPALTFGCSNSNGCIVHTPYAIGTSQTGNIVVTQAWINAAIESVDQRDPSQIGLTENTSDLANEVWADWSLSETVPEPATLVLIAAGLIGLGLTRRKRFT